MPGTVPSYADVAQNGVDSHHDNHREETQKGIDLVGERNIESYPTEKPYTTGIPEVPVTIERTPWVPPEDAPLKDAGTARANLAPSNQHPNGTTENGWAREHQHQTVVQQHVAYWDRDHDGIIWPIDTYNGCRAYGWNIILSAFAAAIIHFGLSYFTLPTWFPDPFFRIYVKNLHKDKHGSDSMTFDTEGRFKPQQFEDIFAKYDRGNKGGLDKWDMVRLVNGQKLVFDFFGTTAASLEWLATYLLLWPEDGVCKKEDIRRVYDGSIFQAKADEHARKSRREYKSRQHRWNSYGSAIEVLDPGLRKVVGDRLDMSVVDSTQASPQEVEANVDTDGAADDVATPQYIYLGTMKLDNKKLLRCPKPPVASQRQKEKTLDEPNDKALITLEKLVANHALNKFLVKDIKENPLIKYVEAEAKKRKPVMGTFDVPKGSKFKEEV